MSETFRLAVALYARYSTDRQDARSIDDQMRRCRECAARMGFEVVAEYFDAAESGSHCERADLQKLLAAAQQRGKSLFKAVLVDDLSRLSRDLGDTWRIVFELLASVDIKVIDVTTGMASDGPGARLTFGAMALVNDTFLQLVRTETHRGLQGRALAGFWTGGRVYGFSTVEEENAPDPEHRRKRPVVERREADVVLRVYRLFVDGWSLKRIAALLNEEGIEAPHDRGRGNKIGRGWGHTTIRAILLNERYLGRFSWNACKWVRVPGKKSRRRVARPANELVRTESPELAIVPRELWDAVQARFAKTRRPGSGRPSATGRHVYLVTGLMRCGACGGSMTIISRQIKAQVRYAMFGCTSNHSRGDAVCANRMLVSERKATAAVVGAIQELVSDSTLIERFVEGVQKRLAAKPSDADADAFQVRIREVEGRVRNLTESLAKLGWSDALGLHLKEEETQLAKLKAARTAARPSRAPLAMPSALEIAGYLGDLVRTLSADPVRGQALLGRHLAPVVMTPNGEGPGRHYRLTGALNLAACLRTLEKPAEGVVVKNGSGGRI
jgi:site-specific DNA recombinase